MAIAFYVIMGIMLPVLTGAVIWWIVEAVRTGYTRPQKQPSTVPEEPSDKVHAEEENSKPHADGATKPLGKGETVKKEQPRSP